MKSTSTIDINPESSNKVTIKKAFIQYILEGTTPKGTSLNDIIQLAQSLSKIEKESLIDSIKATLSLEDGKLTEKRLKACEKIDEDKADMDFKTSIESTTLGFTAGAIARINPFFSAGLGLFSGHILNSIRGEYNKFKENELWDERENRVQMVLNAINEQPKHHATIYKR